VRSRSEPRRIIEKHFTVDHDPARPDHWFSMDVSGDARRGSRISAMPRRRSVNREIDPAAKEAEKPQEIMRRRVRGESRIVSARARAARCSRMWCSNVAEAGAFAGTWVEMSWPQTEELPSSPQSGHSAVDLGNRPLIVPRSIHRLICRGLRFFDKIRARPISSSGSTNAAIPEEQLPEPQTRS
jgi:hypothetical protein